MTIDTMTRGGFTPRRLTTAIRIHLGRARSVAAIGAVSAGLLAGPADAVIVNSNVGQQVLPDGEFLQVDATGAITAGPGIDGVINAAPGITLGNITNFGSIDAGGDGVAIMSDSVVGGDIRNESGGLIQAGRFGVFVSSSEVSGNIENADGGIIEGTFGIGVVSSSLVGGNVVNAGTVDTGLAGIIVDFSDVDGDVRNDATGHITTGEAGIALFSSSFVAGNVANAGTIDVTGGSVDVDGILISSGSVVTGNVANSGTINAEEDGIDIAFSFVVTGIAPGTATPDVINSGGINVGDDGIDLDSAFLEGNVRNTASGVIVAGDDGFDLSSSSFVGGNVVNDGQVDAGAASVDITGSSVVAGPGGIINNGALRGDLDVEGEDGSGGGIDLQNNGLLDIQDHQGVLSGSLVQSATGVLAFNLRNFADYTGLPLDSGTDALLDGQLDLSFVPGFSITPGEVLTLIGIAGTRSGVFANVGDGDLVAFFSNKVALFIDYTDEGDVLLFSRVPAPAPLALLGLGALVGLSRRLRW